jgi:uncharacterized membrane protein YphA (DoxX/SURF4 family)
MTSLDHVIRRESVPTRNARTITSHAPVVARCLLGAAFFVFGLNGFLNFIPPPPPESIPPGAAAFGGAMMKTGYLFQLVKGTEVFAGALLLGNRFVPLALAVLAPIAINIFAFHAFLAPSGIAIAAIVVVLELYLAWSYRAAFKPMLEARAKSA